MKQDKEVLNSLLEQMIAYRKKHFAVEITEVRGGSDYKDEKLLSITHNGNQWTSISLIKQEARQVIEELQEWLRE